jgi:hypothetical protein
MPGQDSRIGDLWENGYSRISDDNKFCNFANRPLEG